MSAADEVYEIKRARRAAVRACEQAKRRGDMEAYRKAYERLSALSEDLLKATWD